MDQSGLSLGSYQLYTGNSSAATHKAFIEFFVTVTQLLGANKTTAGDFAEEIWELERAMAEVMSLRSSAQAAGSMYSSSPC